MVRIISKYFNAQRVITNSLSYIGLYTAKAKKTVYEEVQELFIDCTVGEVGFHFSQNTNLFESNFT